MKKDIGTLIDLDGLQRYYVEWKKACLKRLYSLWFHFYDILEKVIVTAYKSVAARVRAV